ncbi:sensor histidine kinase [Winogradskyella sp.]|uniref:sensor histidine kinase n=1 Tax=Winogradskyella sp. TaxID=1883156 RepID=UPI003AB6E2F1
MLQPSAKTLQTSKVLFHVLFIGVLSFLLIQEAFASIPKDWLFFLTSDALENVTCAAIVYLLYYSILKQPRLWKKIAYTLIFVAILLSIAVLKDHRIHSRIDFEQTFDYFTSFLGQTLLYYAILYFVNRLPFLNSYQKLENELKQAKAQLLKNQLHPHFLFNAFNSLYSLSLKNHPDTPETILKLSSMMRYLTDETQQAQVSLSKEIAFIEKYIAIEKIRFGKDARIQLTINSPMTDEQRIAPFLLITLVENAFKHGFYTNSKTAFVKIDLSIENNKLLFNIENSIFKKQHFQKTDRKGKGLDNLRQRLQLLYPKNARLTITNVENTYRCQLQITLN